ncbi:hypothetical protein IAU59_006299 [Kwoniella sp. CBS 9459]
MSTTSTSYGASGHQSQSSLGTQGYPTVLDPDSDANATQDPMQSATDDVPHDMTVGQSTQDESTISSKWNSLRITEPLETFAATRAKCNDTVVKLSQKFDIAKLESAREESLRVQRSAAAGQSGTDPGWITSHSSADPRHPSTDRYDWATYPCSRLVWSTSASFRRTYQKDANAEHRFKGEKVARLIVTEASDRHRQIDPDSGPSFPPFTTEPATQGSAGMGGLETRVESDYSFGGGFARQPQPGFALSGQSGAPLSAAHAPTTVSHDETPPQALPPVEALQPRGYHHDGATISDLDKRMKDSLPKHF